MQRRQVLVGACAVLLPRPARAAERGFVSIFDGRSTDGWVYGTRAGKPSRVGRGYQVRDRMLVCTASDGGDLFTERQWTDFVLRFEFRLTANANNGIAIRAPLEGDAAYVGMEIQVLDDRGSQYRELRPEQYHGSIYDLVAARRGHQRPVGRWNFQEITAVGSRVTVRLNGAVIVHADLAELRTKELADKHPGIANPGGHIGLLGHGTDVAYRRLRVRAM